MEKQDKFIGQAVTVKLSDLNELLKAVRQTDIKNIDLENAINNIDDEIKNLTGVFDSIHLTNNQVNANETIHAVTMDDIYYTLNDMYDTYSEYFEKLNNMSQNESDQLLTHILGQPLSEIRYDDIPGFSITFGKDIQKRIEEKIIEFFDKK